MYSTDIAKLFGLYLNAFTIKEVLRKALQIIHIIIALSIINGIMDAFLCNKYVFQSLSLIYESQWYFTIYKNTFEVVYITRGSHFISIRNSVANWCEHCSQVQNKQILIKLNNLNSSQFNHAFRWCYWVNQNIDTIV